MNRIDLRRFAAGDFARISSWISTPEDLSEWAGGHFRYPLTEGQLESYLASSRSGSLQRQIFKAQEISTGEVIGHIELSHIWPHLSARVSRVLIGEPSKRRAGLGSEMVRELVRRAFSDHHLDRIDLRVSARNHAAIACYEKCGFVTVGLWRGAIRTPSETIDVRWMTTFRAPGSGSTSPQ